MGLFNNGAEGKTEADPRAAALQSLLSEAVPQPTGRNSARTVAAHEKIGATAYLTQGSTIQGNLKFETPTQIDGQVEGEISAQDNLLIGESAVVTARIRASSITVAGKLSGEIIASERIELRPSARVSANLTTPKLVVHEGALFEGHCAMQPEQLREERKQTVQRKEERHFAQAGGQNHS